MRATCGVMSARMPSWRPLIWSVTRMVLRERPESIWVSSERLYSISGGWTSS